MDIDEKRGHCKSGKLSDQGKNKTKTIFGMLTG